MPPNSAATLLASGRKKMEQGKVQEGFRDILAATQSDPEDPRGFMVLGKAYSDLEHPELAGLSYLRALSLFDETPIDASKAEAVAWNLRLCADKVLPPHWWTRATDPKRLSALKKAAVELFVPSADEALSSLNIQEEGRKRQVVIVGGIGTEAVALAQALPPTAFDIHLITRAGSLAATMAANLEGTNFADPSAPDEEADVFEMWDGFAAYLSQGRAIDMLVCVELLSSQPDIASTQEALSGVPDDVLSRAVIVPRAIETMGQLVSSAAILGQNMVDVEQVKQQLGYDFSAANDLLARRRRPMQAARFEYETLGEARCLLRAPTLTLLRPPVEEGSSHRGVEGAINKTSLSLPSEHGANLCGLSWARCELSASHALDHAPHPKGAREQPTEAAGKSPEAGTKLPEAAVLQPHVWQEVWFLGHMQQERIGEQAGEQTAVVRLIDGKPEWGIADGDADAADGDDGARAGARKDGDKVEDEDEDKGGDARERAAEVLPYHMGMLNDTGRTWHYCIGIQDAVACAERERKARKAQDNLVVLDIGSGTGILSLIAGDVLPGAQVVGCEREPLLHEASQRMLETNNRSGHGVRIVNKLSTEMTVGPEGDLPRPADLVIHEIFGSDPFSEHVLPTMADAAARLTRVSPTAFYMPSAVRLVAALAHSGPLGAALRPDSAAGVNLSVLGDFAPTRVDVTLEEAAGLTILSEADIVATWHFDARPVKHSMLTRTPLRWKNAHTPTAYASAARLATKREAIPPPLPDAKPPVVAGKLAATSPKAADCVVFWFEANCGQRAGWLSTAPGRTWGHHWEQCVQFLAGEVAAVKGGGAVLETRIIKDRVAFRVTALSVPE